MKIGTKGHYAVAAMVELAKVTVDQPVSLTLLAQSQNISLNYLELLFVKLREAGLVKSMRGMRGGYFLAKGPHHITIWDVVRAVGEGVRVNRCDSRSSVGVSCTRESENCLVHDMWAGLGHHIKSYLSTISLEDVLEKRLIAPPPLNFSKEILTYDSITACPERARCQRTVRSHGTKRELHLPRS